MSGRRLPAIAAAVLALGVVPLPPAPPRCELCREPLDAGRCTNGRCSKCHAAHCTPGGSTAPGHGRGTSPSPPKVRCGRCGNETRGHREGDTEYCDACGGVLGPSSTAGS